MIMEEVEKRLGEVSREDENMIFKQLIRNAADNILTTHKSLTPIQQEAYEQLLVQAGERLAEKREEDLQEIIRKAGENKYTLHSKKKNPKTGERKKLGTFKSKKAADERERQIQYFKSQDDK